MYIYIYIYVSKKHLFLEVIANNLIYDKYYEYLLATLKYIATLHDNHD